MENSLRCKGIKHFMKENVEIKISGGSWCIVKSLLPEMRHFPPHSAVWVPTRQKPPQTGFWGIFPCSAANTTHGGSPPTIPRGRAVNLWLTGGGYLQLSKRSKNSHTRVRIIPRALQGPVLIAPLGITIKTWLQDQEDAKGKWLGHGSAHCSTEQPMMPFVFCTQKGSKARHRAPFCLCAKPCWALISSAICSPTFRSPEKSWDREGTLKGN